MKLNPQALSRWMHSPVVLWRMQRAMQGRGSVAIEPGAAGCTTQVVLPAAPADVGDHPTEAGATVEGEGRGGKIESCGDPGYPWIKAGARA